MLIAVATAALLVCATPAYALYSLTTILPWISKNSTSVDLGIIVNNTYFVSDRTNAVVHLVDLTSNTETARITGFVGATIINGTVNKPTSGPNGLLYIPDTNELYVGDGDGSVKVVNLSNNTVVATIPLGLAKRADEMTYDSVRKLAIVTGPDDDIASLSFISITDRKVVKKLSFDNATNGIEQPVWNPADGLVYVSVPESMTNTGGEIDVIETANFTTTRILPVTNCSQHGMVFGANQNLLLGCSQDAILADSVGQVLVISTTGTVLSTVPGIGGADEVAYNPSLNYFYVAGYQYQVNGSATGASDPLVGIIDAATGTLLQTLPTDNRTAHAVAVDPKTNKMLIPLSGSSGYGIAIYDYVNGTGSGNATVTTGTPPMGSATSSGTAKPSSSTAAAPGTDIKSGGLGVTLLVVLVAAGFGAGVV